MSKRQFDQQQKLGISCHAQEVGFREAAKISGVHYTTVYYWQRQLEDLGEQTLFFWILIAPIQCSRFLEAPMMATRLVNGPEVTLVTVTYGDRWHLLERVLHYAEATSSVKEIIVVDNGAHHPIAALAQKPELTKTFVSRVDSNMGSAGGFKLGLEIALDRGSDYIWLLDDDNRPWENALEILIAAYRAIAKTHAIDRFALLSFRLDHQADISMGVSLERCAPKPDSFFGFHIADVPYKFWRRTRWGKPRAPRNLQNLISISYAPYSGLFFHRSVIDRIGLPDPDYVLYGDDNDFTARLTRSDGSIFLVPSSRLEDLEASWNIKDAFASSFEGWLCGGSDLRVYYGVRNQVYFESKFIRQSPTYEFNRTVFLGLMVLMAIRYFRFNRLKLFLSAIRDGASGRLGVHPRFPLT